MQLTLWGRECMESKFTRFTYHCTKYRSQNKVRDLMEHTMDTLSNLYIQMDRNTLKFLNCQFFGIHFSSFFCKKPNRWKYLVLPNNCNYLLKLIVTQPRTYQPCTINIVFLFLLSCTHFHFKSIHYGNWQCSLFPCCNIIFSNSSTIVNYYL